MINVLFIHGFNSSPLSKKAQQTKRYLAKHLPHVKFHCPQVATTPPEAIKQLEHYFTTDTSTSDKWVLIGSSLGGYFSTHLSETFGVKAVLINPAIKPYELLAGYVGEQINPYTEEKYFVETRYLKDLMALEKPQITKNNYMVMVQTGDEVLDYQEAVNKFNGCQLIVQQGGDHSFVNYKNMLPQIVEFLQLKE